MAGVPLFISERGAALMDAAEAVAIAEAAEALRETHGDPALIVIDTLHRNLGDGNENDAADIAAFLQNIDQLIRHRLGCAVLIVHHAGHGDKTRSRGSSSIRAALDHEYRLEVDGEEGSLRRRLVCTKMKDSEPPEPIGLAAEVVELPPPWVDPDTDEPLTSLVLRETDTRPAGARAARPLTGANRIAFLALQQLAQPMFEDEAVRVHEDAWRAAC